MSLLDCQTEEKINKNTENNDGKGKGKKKRMRISLGGDKGGWAVVGGALVIGGLLMATFSIKRNKTRDSNKNPTIAVTKASQDQGSQGLRCLLQTSSSPMANSSGEGHGNTTKSVITREQILTTEIDGPMISKMGLPDSRGKEITKLSSDFGALQYKYHNEDSIPIEITEVKNNGETSAVDQDPDMYSAEDEEDEEESVVGNSEGSEGTGDSPSSKASNTDAIWPAEMIDDTMPELEEACQPQRSGEEDETIQTKKHTQFISDNGFNRYAREENMTIDEDVSTFWVRIFLKLMLLLFLLFIFPIPDMLCQRF